MPGDYLHGKTLLILLLATTVRLSFGRRSYRCQINDRPAS